MRQIYVCMRPKKNNRRLPIYIPTHANLNGWREHTYLFYKIHGISLVFTGLISIHVFVVVLRWYVFLSRMFRYHVVKFCFLLIHFLLIYFLIDKVLSMNAMFRFFCLIFLRINCNSTRCRMRYFSKALL